MPAIVDTEPKGGGAPVTIFESGAIMEYLAEKVGKFFPQEPHQKAEVLQWMYWQMGNQGPKMGEQGHFTARFQGAGRTATQTMRCCVSIMKSIASMA